MARFSNGLKNQLREKVILQSPISLVKAITMAEHLEKHSNKFSHYFPGASTSKISNANDKSLLLAPTDKGGITDGNGKGVANTEVEWSIIKCY